MRHDKFGPFASQCEGKEKYATAMLANKVAGRRSDSLRARLHAYHCPHCGAWHIGRASNGRDLNFKRFEARREQA